MTDRPLTAKESTTIEYYLDPASETFNNWGKSYLRANYSECKNWEANAKRVHDKDVVKQGIADRRARIEVKTERTVQSIDQMQQAAYDLAMRNNQPSAAVSAGTAIARLYGMDKDVHVSQDTPSDLDSTDLDTLQAQAEAVLEARHAGPRLASKPPSRPVEGQRGETGEKVG